jgi:hypothetical protein
MDRPLYLLTLALLSGVFTHIPVLRAGEADYTPSVVIDDADPFDLYVGTSFLGEWATRYSQRERNPASPSPLPKIPCLIADPTV